LQFDQVHARALYDVEVDTSVLSPRECAVIIHDYISKNPQTLAFDRLREQHISDLQ